MSIKVNWFCKIKKTWFIVMLSNIFHKKYRIQKNSHWEFIPFRRNTRSMYVWRRKKILVQDVWMNRAYSPQQRKMLEDLSLLGSPFQNYTYRCHHDATAKHKCVSARPTFTLIHNWLVSSMNEEFSIPPLSTLSPSLSLYPPPPPPSHPCPTLMHHKNTMFTIQ